MGGEGGEHGSSSLPDKDPSFVLFYLSCVDYSRGSVDIVHFNFKGRDTRVRCSTSKLMFFFSAAQKKDVYQNSTVIFCKGFNSYQSQHGIHNSAFNSKPRGRIYVGRISYPPPTLSPAVGYCGL